MKKLLCLTGTLILAISQVIALPVFDTENIEVAAVGDPGQPCKKDINGICGTPASCQTSTVTGACNGNDKNICCLNVGVGDPGQPCKNDQNGICGIPVSCKTSTVKGHCNGKDDNICCLNAAPTSPPNAAPKRVVTDGKRAVWIPVTWGLANETQTQQTMQNLAAKGVNRVYVAVWNQGKTYFNSPSMKEFVGANGLGRDLLSWAIKYAKESNLEIYAWFEYGFIAAYEKDFNTFATKAKSLGWIDDRAHADKYWWLDITKDDPVNFLVSIMTDCAKNYKTLNGVQLDDHFAYPFEIAGNKTARMTEVAKIVSAKFKATTTMLLSLSPNPLATSIVKYNVDWKAYSNWGLFSEYAPQLYTTTITDFRAKLDQALKDIPGGDDQYLVAGLRCEGAGKPTEWSELKQMIAFAKEKKVGISIWYGRCLLEQPKECFPPVEGKPQKPCVPASGTYFPNRNWP